MALTCPPLISNFQPFRVSPTSSDDSLLIHSSAWGCLSVGGVTGVDFARFWVFCALRCLENENECCRTSRWSKIESQNKTERPPEWVAFFLFF